MRPPRPLAGGPDRLRRLFAAAALLLSAAALVRGASAGTSGIHLEYLERSVSPCDDFYRYANGAWLDTVRITGAYPFASSGLETYLRNEAVLVAVLDSAAARVSVERDPTLRKLGALFATLADSTRADREGMSPLAGRLRRIDSIGGRRDLVRAFAAFQAEGDPVPFELAADSDPRDSRSIVAIVRPGGLGLPDRDDYLRPDSASVSLRRAYREHVASLLALAGAPRERAERAAAGVVGLETALAESSLTNVERRDPERIYHRRTVRELAALAPAIDWIAWFEAAGIPRLARPGAALIVEEPSFVRELGRLVARTPLATWRWYLRYHALETAGPWLARPFESECFRFHSRLVGQPREAPRWKRAVAATDGAMGEALGKAFVARVFPPRARARARELVDELQAAFDARLARLGWMSDSTRRQARRKLAALRKKIGYPDRWRDDSRLAIDASRSGWENLRRARAFEQRRQWSRIGGRADRGAWQMSAATLNAYYDWANNEIVFPAAFLQPPMFDPDADDAANYGAAGAVIGHELTHGFDDQGRRFDADGNLVNWWAPADERRFQQRAERMVREFDGFVAIDTLHLNGRLTLGEDLADLGGLQIAYEAYERHLAKHGRRSLDGFTPEQRFFIAYAQSRRSAYLPELTRRVVLSDPHPPDRWRVDGALSNLPEFRAAFGCREGDPMVRPDSERVEIW